MVRAMPKHQRRVPSHDATYVIHLTSSGYLMRSSSGHELFLKDMHQSESFEVCSEGASGVRVGTVVSLFFTERGAPFFTDEAGNPIEVDALAQKTTLRCVTPHNK